MTICSAGLISVNKHKLAAGDVIANRVTVPQRVVYIVAERTGESPCSDLSRSTSSYSPGEGPRERSHRLNTEES